MRQRIEAAIAAAKGDGRDPSHLALTKDDERAIGIGCVLYGGLAVRRAWKAAESHLWARKGTTLKAYKLRS